MIILNDVSKIYNEGRPNALTALDNITLTVRDDAVTVFKGPSGSGKTTLMTLIGCLARPTSGRVSLNGELISNLPEKFLTEIRRTTFGFVFQRFNLVRGLTTLDNVMLPAYPLAPARDELIERARGQLADLDLADKADVPVELLSGGEAQRAAIARALINDPQIIIADEPTANLDTELALRFLDIVKDLRQRGKTVLMTSHDPRIWEADIVDEVVAMKDGRIAGDFA
ncbi:MAG: ABC transporter ATP-binding protein [Hyphomicrobiales bacterium]|nr:MAG: ABC transporter ATP-binding protein [Hyphomicrobiales bacterium]